MSYEIYYDKLVIRVEEDKYLFMLLCGDNNMYDNFGHGRKRSRNWEPFRINGNYIHTKKEIMDNCESVRKDYFEYQSKDVTWESFKNNFGWYVALAVGSRTTHTTEYKHYKNFFLNGFDNAVELADVEKMGEWKFNVIIRSSWGSNKKDFYHEIRTTEDFHKYLAEAKNVHDRKKSEYFIIDFGCISYDRVQENIKQIKKERKVSANIKKMKDLEEFFVITCSETDYVEVMVRKECSPYCITYVGRELKNAKIFMTKKDADNYIIDKRPLCMTFIKKIILKHYLDKSNKVC